MGIALLILCFIGAPSSSPFNQKTTDSAQSKSQTDKQPSKPPSSTSIDKQAAANTSNQNGSNVTSNPNERAIRIVSLPERSTGDTVALLCTILLTVAAIAGIIVAVSTLKVIARQTAAIERQTALQHADLRQWVTIQGFRDAVEPRFAPNTAPEMELQLSFEIANPTKMPLTLEWYVIAINAAKYSSRLNVTLAPDQVHGLKASINYTDEVRNKYIRDGYLITVTGVIAYTDALKEFQKQRFGYLYKCGPVDGETLNYQGPLPDEDIEKEQSKDG